MITYTRYLTLAVAACVGVQAAKAALNIPSDGSDGALVVSANKVIDLSQAVTGSWDTNNSANAGKGVYDPEKWAVVFKYSSVSIQSGATVTFKNHASRAPVVWLVQSNVTISGTLSLDGQGPLPPPTLAEPGPGGFRGGSGNYAPGAEDAAGFGPGGSPRRVGEYNGAYSGGASYGSVGYLGSATYGNPSLIPLIGGSGAGGRYAEESTWYATTHTGSGGGAGGGAILIGCAGSLSVSGTIRADGGNGFRNNANGWDYPGGSGGGIRLVADVLAGNGVVEAVGGKGLYYGGVGRIRLERCTVAGTVTITPDPSVVTLAAGATPQIWLPADGPTVKIISVGGQVPPADPRAEFGPLGPDVNLLRVTNTTVVVETLNVEKTSVVTVRATPRSNGNFTEKVASLTQVVSESPLVLRWTATIPVIDGYSAVQARVVRP